MLRFTLVTLAVLAMALALGTSIGTADERWIIEPGPEAANAQKLGSADVERAQKLAKEQRFAEATAVLQDVDRKWPAAVHDCNLALAYLRDNALTRAQLVWDLGATRNGARPKWCTGDVSTQISDALRKAGYVPTTIEVVPPDAVVEVSGIAMRSMRTVWLPPGIATFNASAPGHLPKAVQTTVAAPVSRVSITLEKPTVETPDAAVEPVITPPAVPDAGVVSQPAITPDAAAEPIGVEINGHPGVYKIAALVTAVSCLALAGVSGYLTYDARKDANARYTSDPKYNEAKDSYDQYKLGTDLFIGLGAAATAVFVYFVATDNDVRGADSGLSLGGGPGSIGVSYSGTFGESR